MDGEMREENVMKVCVALVWPGLLITVLVGNVPFQFIHVIRVCQALSHFTQPIKMVLF